MHIPASAYIPFPFKAPKTFVSAFSGPFLLLLLFVAGCKQTEVVPNKAADLVPNVHLTLGNPSRATTDLVNINNYLIEKPQYVLSYSRDRGTPNWVSWQVSADWLGTAPRQDDFRPDEALPAHWFQALSSSYTGSGFDRGHNCPSADRTRSVQDNSATFLMTNMIPQAPQNNQETWANLEDYTRDLVRAGREVYVIMGSYGAGGTGSKGAAQTIAAGRITVPKQIWKVIVVLPEGDNDVQRITPDTRIIAVNTPNDNAVSSDWGAYRTTVDAIEQATGYDLLANVPAAVQQVLEAKVDTEASR
jgi:endonuclease G, mitochondrial